MQVQSSLEASNNTGILNTCTRLWLTKSEQTTPVDLIKVLNREGSRVWQTPEEGRRTYRPKRCGNNNKDEDNCPKTLNDKNQQASSQKIRQQTPEEGRRHIGRNVVEITIKMKTIVQKPLMIKINKLRLRNLDNYDVPVKHFSYNATSSNGSKMLRNAISN